jgi:hypothetical protein
MTTLHRSLTPTDECTQSITVSTSRFLATYFIHAMYIMHSRDSEIDIATGYGLDDQGVGVRVPVEANMFTSPCRPDRLWVPPSLLANGYRKLFPRVKATEG